MVLMEAMPDRAAEISCLRKIGVQCTGAGYRLAFASDS